MGDIVEQQQEDTANAGEQHQEQQPQEFKAPSSQEELDRIIQGRLDRERKKFADYDEIKAKADKLTEVENANKTEAQKAADRADAAEKRATELEQKALRADVATEKKVPAALLSGSTKEELEASADALIEFKGKQATGPVVPEEGTGTGLQQSSEHAEALRQLGF